MKKPTLPILIVVFCVLPSFVCSQWISNDVSWLGASTITNPSSLLDNDFFSDAYLAMSYYSTNYIKDAYITFPVAKTITNFKFKYSFPATVQSPCHGYPGPIWHECKGKLYYINSGNWFEAYPVTDNLNTAANPSICEVVDSVEFLFPDTITAQEWKFEMIGRYHLGGAFQTTTKFKVFELGFKEYTEELSCPGAPTVTDIDGNVYNTVLIGDQCWMKENLKVTHYPNSDEIPYITDNNAWAALGDNNTDDAYCYYNNNSSSEYGALYTYSAAIADNWQRDNADGQGICPDGWHLPTDAEWTVLIEYLGGSIVAGGKMKESGTSHWNSPNTGAKSTLFFCHICYP